MPKNKWGSKQARELFCKCVNSFIIKAGADKDPIIDFAITQAKKVVDSAFEYYPDNQDEKEEKMEF